MNMFNKGKWGLAFKAITWLILISFSSETLGLHPVASAQDFTHSLPMPGTMVSLSALSQPVLMKGIKIYPDNPFRFDFFMDPGQQGKTNIDVQKESNKLIKYFLASLTVPEKEMWVNLSPYEKDRIMPLAFGTTEMGRDLLAQDYLLKQISASLLDPSTPKGSEFWKKIYAKVNDLAGAKDAINTFNKVWIIPESAEVYTKGDSAFVVDSHLKVMLEEDYQALAKSSESLGPVNGAIAQNHRSETSQVIRDVIIPAIENDVNEGENFELLRQVYHSMILATWFKRHLRQSVFGKVYVGQNKVAGVDIEDKDMKEKIYQQYLTAFKKGVFNFIREDYDSETDQLIPRKYFAGGIAFQDFGSIAEQAYRETQDPSALRKLRIRPIGFLGQPFFRVSSVVVNPAGVEWYNTMVSSSGAVAAATSHNSSSSVSLSGGITSSINNEFKGPKIRKGWTAILSALALFSFFVPSQEAQGAQFGPVEKAGMVVKIDKGDTLGSIVHVLKEVQQKTDADFQSPLPQDVYGANGAVAVIAKAMGIKNANRIFVGDTYVIPTGLLSPAAQAALADDAVHIPSTDIKDIVTVSAARTKTPPPDVDDVVTVTSHHSTEVPESAMLNIITEPPAIVETPSVISALPAVSPPEVSAPAKLANNTLPKISTALQAEVEGNIPDDSQRSYSSVAEPGTYGFTMPDIRFGNNPFVPITLFSLLSAGLVYTSRQALWERATPMAMAATTQPQYSKPAVAVAATPQGVTAPVPVGETQAAEFIASHIRSISLPYLESHAQIVRMAQKAAGQLGDELGRTLAESGLWSESKAETLVENIKEGIAAGLEFGGEYHLDPTRINDLIQAEAAQLAQKWFLSGSEDFNEDVALEEFVEQTIDALVKRRMDDFAVKLDNVLSDENRNLYKMVLNSSIALAKADAGHSVSVEQFAASFLKEVAPDMSHALGIDIILHKDASVTPLHPEIATVEKIESIIRQQSVELQVVNAQMHAQAKILALQMGVGLTGAFKKSKLSEAVAQPSARDAVLHHFVPELTRYTLAGLYQRYDAAKVEKVIQEGALKLAFRFSKKSINNAELRTQIDVFIQNELKQSIEDGVRESFTKMNQDFLNDGMKDVYLAAINSTMQVERAVANGSGILIVPTVEKIAKVIAYILKEDHDLNALPFFAMFAAQKGSAQPAVEAPAVLSAEVREDAASRAPPQSFAMTDTAILLATATGMIASGNTDFGSLLMTLAAPFAFRGGVASSLWLHEFSHVVAGGPRAWTGANLRGNLSWSEWGAMLIPFFGKVPTDAHVKVDQSKGLSAWFNRFVGLGTSTAIVAGIGMGLYALLQSGINRESLAFIPVLFGSISVWLGSLNTDLLKPMLGKAKDCEFGCGVAILMSKRQPGDRGIFSKRLRNIFMAMGRVTDIRGQQAAGVAIQAIRKGKISWLKERIVNPKGDDLPEGLDRRITNKAKLATLAGFNATPDYTVVVGHYRYGTYSAPAEKETHPHQWMPNRPVKVWSLENNQLVQPNKILGITVVANGDFDYWKVDNQQYSNGTVGLWLERILHTPNDTDGDSPKIAGMMDYLVTKGMWGAAARFAYYEEIAPSFSTVFGGQEILKDAPNTALSKEDEEQFQTRFNDIFTREGQKLVRPGDKELKDLWSSDRADARHALVNTLVNEGLRGMAVVQDWSKEQRRKFVEKTLEAFLLNDEYRAIEIFLDRAVGSFGLGIGSTLMPGGVIVVADGQPLAIGWDESFENLLVVSEPTALKVDLGNGKQLDYRLTLRQNLGRGEIVRITGTRDVKIYSRDKKRELNINEVRERVVPLKDNPYVSRLPNIASDDPVGDDIHDTSSIMSQLKTDWENPDSFNRQTARNIFRLLLQEKIANQIRGYSEEFASIEPHLRQKADQLSIILNSQLITFLSMNLDPSKNWGNDLQLHRASARLGLLLEGALNTVLDQEHIEQLIHEQAVALSEELLHKKMTVDEVRIRVHQFAQEELKVAIEDEFDRAADQVQKMIDSWKEVIEADLLLQARRALARGTSGDMAKVGEIAFQKIEKMWRTMGLQPGHTPKKRGVDLVVTGMEISQWMGEQFVTSLKSILPELRIEAVSSNKVLEDPVAAGIDDHTIVLAISQSGQTFPTLNASIMLEQLAPGRVFALTGEWDTLLGQAVGQNFSPESPFSGRIMSNLTGFRPSEAVSVTGTATHAALTELFIRLGEDFTDLFPSEKPLGMNLTKDSFSQLKNMRDQSLEEMERISGTNRNGEAINTTENKSIYKLAKKWARHVLDEPFSRIITSAHLILAVIGGILIFPLIAKLIPVTLIAAPIALAAGGVVQYFFFEFFKYTVTLVMRVTQHREPFARVGKRTIVIGDQPYVHQSLEIFLTKLNSLSKAATAIDVHGANPADHMIARFGHRVVRGTLIWLGMTDGRLGGKLKERQSSIEMTARQGKGVRNYGVGPEVIAVGRDRQYNKNISDADIVLSGEAPQISEELKMLYEDRFDSLARLVAGQVFFYRMQRIVSTLDLSPRWRLIWPWAWKMHRTQSGPRIATTASPRSVPDYSKFKKTRPVLPLGLQARVQNEENVAAVAGSQNPSASSSIKTDNLGGINLNPALMKMNIKNDGEFPAENSQHFIIDPQIIQTMTPERFEPLIIEIVPVTNVDMFLGMAQTSQDFATAVH